MNSKRFLPSIFRSLAWRIAITVFAVNVLYVNSYLGNPMSKSILDLTVSLVDRGSPNIDPFAYNSADTSRRGEHFYSGMPPGLSFICVPHYLAAKTWLWLVVSPQLDQRFDKGYLRDAFNGPHPEGRHATIVLLNLFICIFGCSVLAAIMAVMFHRALALLDPDLEERRRLVTTWLFSFGTLWFLYSPGIYHRIVSAFLCFAAFLLVLSENAAPDQSAESKIQNPKSKIGLLFGSALGLAVATSYEIAIVALVLIAYAAATRGRRWAWGWTAAGLALFLALVAAYHTACFGAPWRTPYAMRVAGSVVPPMFRDGAGLAIFDPARLIAFLFGSKYGFFFYSPILLLALPALAQLRKGGGHRGVAATAFGIFLLLLAFHYLTGYRGLPGEFGFRMMKPAIPFLMLLVPLSYRWSWRWTVPLLTALSAVILAKGVMFGVHAGRPFWSDYLRRLQEEGFSNYTLGHVREFLWPGVSPWAISAIHLAALVSVLLLLRRFVWRKINKEEQNHG